MRVTAGMVTTRETRGRSNKLSRTGNKEEREAPGELSIEVKDSCIIE